MTRSKTPYRLLLLVIAIQLGISGCTAEQDPAPAATVAGDSDAVKSAASNPATEHSDHDSSGKATTGEHKHTNALIDSTSPYLLQHAHNPVNWMPWGPAAFALAKKQNKPVFVSIGYSTCYWCHVMERESFEDEEVAEVLNEHYITIKVDREERPDIDEQLMLATQLMTGRGGWPNSIWLTPDGKPWMAGTYFPKQQFISGLMQLSDVWKTKTAEVRQQAESLSRAIADASEIKIPDEIQLSGMPVLQRVLLELKQSEDKTNGGFGTKPKFPPHGILRLLAFAARNGDKQAESMMDRTLNGIWLGGIHDHVGGGFHRYSTDEKWFLPHFEKMLYDNAQLMRAFTEAFVATKQVRYRLAVEDIYRWLEREMTHEAGGFYSAIDSESEGGEEGRYYTWAVAELQDVLGDEDAKYFAEKYHFDNEGNFVEEASGHRPGTNIPFISRSQPNPDNDQKLRLARSSLLAARASREYPHLDDKILTSWNGLMISALARAGSVFDEPKYIAAAENAANFTLAEMQRDGQLLRSWRGGKASLPGYLNDYAFYTDGLVELHAATQEQVWLSEATRLADDMVRLFEDRENGGFYFTSLEHEKLLLRSKNLKGGGNLPIGNGVAIQVLLRLHDSTKEARFLKSAEKGLKHFSGLIHSYPRQAEHLVLADLLRDELAK